MDANPSLRWDDLQLLLAVARAGSFLAAGREAQAATSTISRRLAQLEADVGTPLVERRSDGVRLTEAGRRLAETAQEVDLRLRSRLRDLPSAARGLEGTIRITAGDGFAETLVAAIGTFGARHPGVSFEVVIEQRPLDLVHREADLAIRTGPRREGTLVYRVLARLPYGLWVARGYAQRHDVPRTAADLSAHAFVGFAEPLDRLPAMRWLRQQGATRFTVRTTSFAALVAAGRAGLGIVALPDHLGAGLDRVLPALKPDPLTVYLAYHPEVRRLVHVRAFAETLTGHFRALAP